MTRLIAAAVVAFSCSLAHAQTERQKALDVLNKNETLYFVSQMSFSNSNGYELWKARKLLDTGWAMLSTADNNGLPVNSPAYTNIYRTEFLDKKFRYGPATWARGYIP